MDILRYIGTGAESAVTRSQLKMYTGCPDRAIRTEIRRLCKAGILIINLGKGYFIPTVEEYMMVDQYERSLRSYVKSFWILIRAIGKWKKANARPEQLIIGMERDSA